ncbi:MAG: DNA starvation/stationary phase protection protein [Eubacteriales bacterium]|nr:DNA starvation/stationary phase protection protein [Eubacteriales bacterium]
MSNKSESKLKTDFNKYLANLAVMNFKVHNIHWNVEGEQFIRVHLYTDELYEELFEYFDDVAEHMKKFEIVPDSTMKTYLKNATIEEIEPRQFTCQEAFEIVLKDLEQLREQATDLRNASDEENWFSAVSMFEDQIDSYNKRIWFLRASTNTK